MDTNLRSWIKAASWRLTAIIVLGIIAYLITGSWKDVTIITVLYHGTQIAVYYLHERVWERISWGKKTHPLAVLPVTKTPTPEDYVIIVEKLQELGYID